MKHLHLLVLLFLTSMGVTFAQTTPYLAKDYNFKTSTNVALEDMSAATTILGPIRVDDQMTAQTAITFPFAFAGKTFNAFQAFSSGTLLLNTLGEQSTVNLQLILPWADALGTGDNGHISYKVVGTTNRKLVVEFFMAKYRNAAFPALADKKYQLWLFEHTNRIQFVYGDGNVQNQGPQAIVGIAGSDASGDLLQVNTLDHTITNDESYVSTVWPGFGRSYFFSPDAFTVVEPIAAVSTDDATNICEGGMALLTATLQDGTATGYQWLKNGLPIADATAQVYTATQTGSYTVQIAHADGTATSALINVYVNQLSATIHSVNISCGTGINGTITINNATGGNGMYAYSIGNGIWQQGSTFSGLVAATYTVKMRTGSCVKELGNVAISDLSAAPVANIITSKAGACANVTLTAYPDDAMSYAWSNGATSRSITLDHASADGKYSVVVSNGAGCDGQASYTYNKQNQLGSYAIVSLKGASIGENNIVNGGVGNAGLLPLYIDRNTTVNGFVSAATVNLNQPVNITGGTFNTAANVTIPTVYTNTSVTSNLTNKSIADNFNGTITGNHKLLVIGKRAQVIVLGNIYGKITLKEGAKVSFAASDISIDDLIMDDGSRKTGEEVYTEVTFNPGAIIRIKDKVAIGKNSRVNAAFGTFYLDDERKDNEKFNVNGSNTIITCNVLIKKGTLSVRGADATNPAIMNGAFISEYVVSDKYVTWNRAVCNTFAPRAQAAITSTEGKLKLNVYPNPGTGVYRLNIRSANVSTASVVITSLNGTVIRKDSYSNVQNGRALPVNLGNQPAGTYIIKVITTQGTQSIKVIKK